MGCVEWPTWYEEKVVMQIPDREIGLTNRDEIFKLLRDRSNTTRKWYFHAWFSRNETVNQMNK